MKKRLNYRKLLKDWMQHYDMTDELSKSLFIIIWTKMQISRAKTKQKGEEANGS